MAVGRLVGPRTSKLMVQAMERRAWDIRGRVFQATLLLTLAISLFILGVLIVGRRSGRLGRAHWPPRRGS